MLKRIRLVNFMSHIDTVIEPSAGLTVIAGENNSGKSAIVAALQAVCSNATGDYMVRHGEKECRVIIETDDDQEIEWRRKSKKVSYIVNGEVIDRTRGAVPEKVQKALRMDQVVVENEEFDVHFGEQKRPIFLLDATSGQRAAFFASSSDAAKLIEMQNLHKSKVADARRTVKEYESRETRFVEQLKTLEPLPKIDDQVLQVQKLANRIRDTEARRERLVRLSRELNSQRQGIRRLDATAKALGDLDSPPDQKPVALLRSRLRELSHLAGEERRLLHRSEELAKLPSPPQFVETQRLEQTIKSLRGETADVTRRSSQSQILAPIEAPRFQDVSILESVLQRLRNASQQWDCLKREGQAVSSLTVPPRQSSHDTLAKMIFSLNQLESELNPLQKKLRELEKLTEGAHQAFHESLIERGECPTCGRVMRPESGDPKSGRPTAGSVPPPLKAGQRRSATAKNRGTK